MYRFLFPSLLLLLPLFSFGQYNDRAVWLEGGGGTPSYAIQYEQFLADGGRNANGLYWRAGLGLERARISVPLSIHWVSGGNPHHLAIMAGATPQIRDLDTQDSDTFLFLVSGIGYRYESSRHRWMLSFMGHPLLLMDPTPQRLIDRTPQANFRLSVGFGVQL